MANVSEQAQDGKFPKTQVDLDKGIDTKAAANFLGCSVGYLKARRMDNSGPDYYRLGSKAFYIVRRLCEYRERKMVRSAR